MSVLARSDDGRWVTVRAIGPATADVVVDLLGDDAAEVFALDEPAPVLATMPSLPGAPEAICLQPDGSLLVIVTTADERPSELRSRLLQVVDGIAELTLLELMSASPAIGLQHTPGSWLVERLGGGDAVDLDHAIEQRLESGNVSVLIAARNGYGQVALPIAELRASRHVSIRCFDVVHLAAGSVRLVEAYEIAQRELDAAARAAELRANSQLMLQASSRTLGAEALPLVDAILRHSEAFFGAVSYRGIGELVVVEAWLEGDHEPEPVVRLDSTGAMEVRLADLDAWDRQFFLQSVERIIDAQLWDDPRRPPDDVLTMSLLEHLGDVSLVEQFVGALSDAFLATMCTAMVPAAVERRWAA